MNKSISLLTVLFLQTFASPSFALFPDAGGVGSGGGDLCEARFKTITRDLNTWIEAGGAGGLVLTNGSGRAIQLAQYTGAMKSAIADFQIVCVGPGDPDFPVVVDGAAKECRSYHDETGKGRVICDRNKFYAGLPDPENNANQYRIVHHEFATLAGLEVPKRADSEYWLSEQITGFLTRKSVLKLAVKPGAANNPKIADYTYTVHSKPSSFALSPDRRHFAYNTDEGIAILDLVKGQNVVTMEGKFADSGTLVYSPSGDTICGMDIPNMMKNHVRCYDTSSGKEKFRLERVGELVFVPGGSTFISLTGKPSAEVRSLADGRLIREFVFAGPTKGFNYRWLSAISPDGRQLIVHMLRAKNTSGTAMAYYALDLGGGKIRYSGLGGSPSYRTDGKLLALALDGTEGLKTKLGYTKAGVLLLDPATGKEVKFVEESVSGPSGVEFLPDGRLLEKFNRGGNCDANILSADKFSDALRMPCGPGPAWRRMDPQGTLYLGGLTTGLDLAVSDLRTGHPFATISTTDDYWDSFVLSSDRALAITGRDVSADETLTIRVLEIPPRP